MRVFIGMETSGQTREAFRRLGHDAWSCDLLPAQDGSPFHLQGDVFDIVENGEPWDLGVFHPTCTFLTNSAAWAFKDPDFARYPGVGYHQKPKPETLTGAARREARELALADVRRLFALFPTRVKRLAIENPVGAISNAIEKPAQIIQPYQFGDDASKATCLWLRMLPPPNLGAILSAAPGMSNVQDAQCSWH